MKYTDINLHSHTYRCHHADGSVREYVEEAIRHQMQVIGIADHTPFPETVDHNIRMDLEELPLYIEELEEAQRNYPKIRILKALECDYDAAYIDFYKEVKGKYQLDYLIGSVHFLYDGMKMVDIFGEPIDRRKMRLYTDRMLENIDTEIFSFIAHPDLFCMNLEKWDDYVEGCVREICEAAQEKKKPLEININGSRKPGSPYPNHRFWEIASEYDIETLINTDAHKVQYLCENKEIGFEIQQKHGLKQWDYDGIM